VQDEIITIKNRKIISEQRIFTDELFITISVIWLNIKFILFLPHYAASLKY
jgi:uncharacterized membrane protein